MTERRTSKQIYVYDSDASYIKDHLRDYLGVPTYADAVHELIERYKTEKKTEQVQDIIQKEFAKNFEQYEKMQIKQKEMQRKMTAIGKELSTLAELSSDFYYRNQYLRSGTINVGTDCDAWKNAEIRVKDRIKNQQERAASHLGRYR